MYRATIIIFGIFILLTFPVSFALAAGFQLGESNEQLKLKYDVSIYDHDTGRVTIKFTLKDPGRLKPITSIDFYIPSAEKHNSGGYKADLTISMATNLEENQQVGTIHIRKDWAARAEIQLKTGYLDGKQKALTWYYHSIPLKDLVFRAQPHKSVN